MKKTFETRSRITQQKSHRLLQMQQPWKFPSRLLNIKMGRFYPRTTMFFGVWNFFIILLMAEILHQLRLVVYPIIYRVSAPSQVVSRISAINSTKQNAFSILSRATHHKNLPQPLEVGNPHPTTRRSKRAPRLFWPQQNALPIPSMYGIFTYIYHKNQVNVGKYTIHGCYGLGFAWKTSHFE